VTALLEAYSSKEQIQSSNAAKLGT